MEKSAENNKYVCDCTITEWGKSIINFWNFPVQLPLVFKIKSISLKKHIVIFWNIFHFSRAQQFMNLYYKIFSF